MIKRFKVPKMFILVGFFTLILVHFLIKDHFYLSGILFYAFPLFGIITIGIVCAMFFIKDKKLFKILIIFIVSLSAYWWFHSFHFEPETTNVDNKQTALFWNIANQKIKPLNIILKHVAAENPEFISLVETDNISDSIFKIYQNQLKDYQLLQLKGDMIFGSKHPIAKVFYESENDDYAFNHITLNADTGPVEILIIDLYGSPFHNKKYPFEILFNYLNNNTIDLILGDFNTPYESIYFRTFETDFNSFHGLNTGFTYTWPYRLPLYELDHIWIAKKHRALKLQKKNYAVSDHSMLIGHFKLVNHEQN